MLFPKVQGPAQPEGKKTRQVHSQSFQVGRVPIRCVPWKHIPTACHLALVPLSLLCFACRVPYLGWMVVSCLLIYVRKLFPFRRF